MKSKFIILSLFLCIALTGCENEDKNLTQEEKNIKKFNPKFLFEYDGIKVYEFYNGSHTIYFTNAQGQVQWKETKIMGKVVYSEQQQVNCN